MVQGRYGRRPHPRSFPSSAVPASPAAAHVERVSGGGLRRQSKAKPHSCGRWFRGGWLSGDACPQLLMWLGETSAFIPPAVGVCEGDALGACDGWVPA